MRLRRSTRRKLKGFFPKSEGFFQESKVSSEEAEGFFRRSLGLNTHKFPKRGAASLTDLPGLRLRLPELHLCLPSHVNNGKAEQQQKGFHKRASFLKTRTVSHQFVSGEHMPTNRGRVSVVAASRTLWYTGLVEPCPIYACLPRRSSAGGIPVVLCGMFRYWSKK